jgi:hypothetical protein
MGVDSKRAAWEVGRRRAVKTRGAGQSINESHVPRRITEIDPQQPSLRRKEVLLTVPRAKREDKSEIRKIWLF